MMAHWNNERDGSLQGAETAEYVLKKPSSLKEVRTALDYIDLMYKAPNTQVDDTVRAGVHVHVNCQHLTMTQLYSFMTFYLILENVLVGWCGQDRKRVGVGKSVGVGVDLGGRRFI